MLVWRVATEEGLGGCRAFLGAGGCLWVRKYMTPDIELLSQYAKPRDEATFAELGRRHLDHVYSTALRLVSGDAHLAEDVCQLVFADLARKAGVLANCHALSSWLHTSAR